MSSSENSMDSWNCISFPLQETKQNYDYSGSISHHVYYKGQGPGVIILHELPGMTSECLRFADYVVKHGFTVYLPLFFGKPGESNVVGNLFSICISREFKLFSNHESGKITDWLKALCRYVNQQTNGSGVGVIGMCLTGGFALLMMVKDRDIPPTNVMAPVISQPSLPINIIPFTSKLLGRKRALGVTDEAFNCTRKWAEQRQEIDRDFQIPVFRFQEDKLCPQEKFNLLRDKIGAQFMNLWEISREQREQAKIPADRTHSVLTGFSGDLSEVDPTEKARKYVIKYLQKQLM